MIGFNGIAASQTEGEANKRRAGRFRIEGRSCALGMIEDISSRGLRCRGGGVSKCKRGALYTVMLPTSKGPVEATVRLIWTRRAGLFGRLIGAEFVDPTDEIRRAAMQLASETAADFRMKRLATR